MEHKKVKDKMRSLLNLISLNSNNGCLFIYSDEFIEWYNSGPFGENVNSFETLLGNRIRNGKIY